MGNTNDIEAEGNDQKPLNYDSLRTGAFVE
jgi:hypothetical protein